MKISTNEPFRRINNLNFTFKWPEWKVQFSNGKAEMEQ